MTNLCKSKLLVLIIMLLPFIQSCAEMKSWISPKSSVKTSAPVKDSSERSVQGSAQTANLAKRHPVKTSVPVKDSSERSVQGSAQAANLGKKHSVKTSAPVKDSSQTSVQGSAQGANLAREHMEAGEYQKAIDAYDVEHRKCPHDQIVVGEYVKSIENIKSVADKAFDKEDFVTAGRNYDVLLKNHANFKKFDEKLSFNTTHLDEKLCLCKKAIFKQGFQEYRKGNLSGAIALWEGLLVIDPQNTDIKEALRTAKMQQRNLQEIQ